MSELQNNWYPVKGFEGILEVNKETTEVRRLFDIVICRNQYGATFPKHIKARILSPRDNQGYQVISFRLNGTRIDLSVHRIMAETFIPNPNNLPEVNHKDGIKSHNYLSNLEWVSSADNKRHAFITGLNIHKKRLSENTRMYIRNSYSPRGKSGKSQKELASELNLGISTIYRIRMECDV